MLDIKQAVLYSDIAPTPEQEEGFRRFLTKKYGTDVKLSWEEDSHYASGFKLVVGADVYDWSRKGVLTQFTEAIDAKKKNRQNLIPLLKEALEEWELNALPEEIGVVVTVGDGIAMITGLENASYGEIVLFEDGIRGMVQSLKDDIVGCMIFDANNEITAGSIVRRTGKTASMPVGNAFLGRVVDALGVPIDNGGDIEPADYNPIERKAPAIIDRQAVNQSMNTGLIVIDSMFPIGRGQRELIIGDRQTGKTAIAVDTIINQKGKDCICVYVAIGQKASSVAQLVETLRVHGALEYTAIVAANASDADPLQYLAPYSGCALAEYFMDRGKDVLIIYDDLSKHATAYRAISLLLEHPPGREAYPGDIFYLHSRLLERSARLNDEKGGGSITALPIVETQDGDVSAYIPTNIISITDGQIYLESNLFFAGQRPAVNVGLSVSRVGGDAQTKAMKKAAGSLRLELAQYREIEVFTKFSSDLDDTTKKQLAHGANLMRMLRQPQYKPYQHGDQIVLLVSFTNKCAQGIPEEKIEAYIQELLQTFRQKHESICHRLDRTGVLEDEQVAKIVKCAKEVAVSFIEKEEE